MGVDRVVACVDRLRGGQIQVGPLLPRILADSRSLNCAAYINGVLPNALVLFGSKPRLSKSSTSRGCPTAYASVLSAYSSSIASDSGSRSISRFGAIARSEERR